jgi:preprotein translocase subunit SecG
MIDIILNFLRNYEQYIAIFFIVTVMCITVIIQYKMDKEYKEHLKKTGKAPDDYPPPGFF